MTILPFLEHSSDRPIVINYFGPSMYEALGLSASQTLLVQGIYGAVGPIANILYAVYPIL